LRIPRESLLNTPLVEIVLLNSQIVILETGLIELLYIQAFPILTHSATKAIRQDNNETIPSKEPSPEPPLEPPLEPSLNPPLKALFYDHATFTLYINPKLLKQITKDT
jgi:hypothetical protein